ncbi:chemotaxis-specific protein-glutamate methyltransferase CheB [Chitinasiproducens palmae]|uniref:protein-glutamate methylesterase n=1 Tax=Chitinasiproducens palmae TaxID=1770053 RepID=A0A1H2PK96_9BURK|nr:chemotaxis-specific protein-glutamate methyltransferase CheB [Chitinasiproducens palmae]SDV46393.1 two-component system, chemotaxis family, response regulator CheB/two-component system, chemotaxis family, response regulator WspF [Chitinasiproducens palmae]
MRIAIVNDLPLAVAALSQTVTARGGHEIAWVASDGERAIAQCALDRPDLILMDLIMPRVDGVEATRRIMAATPCPILIVTVDIGANVPRVYDAMAYGALDAVDTPSLAGADAGRASAPLLEKIARIAQMHRDAEVPAALPVAGAQARALPAALLAIGASAGGPGALARILGGLPEMLRTVAGGAEPPAVVIVQHVDASFAEGMASWLDSQTTLPVRVAEAGEAPVAGSILLAATNDHLELDAGCRLRYTPEPRAALYRPSVDVFFDSVVRHWQGEAVGVLLTGMGRDGALGLRAMRRKGFFTIAQDKETSAVYGMPKAAAELDAASEILPLDWIARAAARALYAAGRR